MTNQELSTTRVDTILRASDTLLSTRQDIDRISELKIYAGLSNRGTYTKIVELADKYGMLDLMETLKAQVEERLKIIEAERAEDLKGKLVAQ